MDMELTKRVAVRFIEELRKDISETNMAEVVRRNATPEYMGSGSCATHDYIDANEAMNAAMIAEGLEDIAGYAPTSTEFQRDADVWAAAWEFARGAEFDKGRMEAAFVPLKDMAPGSASAEVQIQCSACHGRQTWEAAAGYGWRTDYMPFTYICPACYSEILEGK